MSTITNTDKIKVDKLDYMNETQLRIYLRRTLNLIHQIKNGTNDDCEYDYYFVQNICNTALDFECAVAPCSMGNKPHTHEINEWKEYFHPMIIDYIFGLL